jgi:hypothetical protein
MPTLLHGSETWTLTASQLKRLEAAEMRLLRPLAGHTLLDHKRNEDIRKKLNIENITSIINTYKKNWYEHVTRMPPHRTPHKTTVLQTIRKKERRTRTGKKVGRTSYD